jgi:membrane protein YqaA with SNARE-associated domain
MKFNTIINKKIGNLLNTPYFTPLLFVAAFLEGFSSFFPFTVFFIIITAARPAKAYRFALYCTLGASAGALAGYVIGYFGWFDKGQNFSSTALFFFNHVPGFTIQAYEKIQLLYKQWGGFFIFVAAFTPIPFELATITSGIFKINIIAFILTVFAGRGARFFLMAFLISRFGPGIRHFMEKYIRVVAVSIAAAMVLTVVFIKIF